MTMQGLAPSASGLAVCLPAATPPLSLQGPRDLCPSGIHRKWRGGSVESRLQMDPSVFGNTGDPPPTTHR